MSAERQAFRVSCKCALYSQDGGKVLLADYGTEGYGLPGGHMDAGETPDETMLRELHEELGLEGVELKRTDFWVHNNGKIILGYTGELDSSHPLRIQAEELRDCAWTSIDDIESGKVSVPSYSEFICKFRSKYSSAAIQRHTRKDT